MGPKCHYEKIIIIHVLFILNQKLLYSYPILYSYQFWLLKLLNCIVLSFFTGSHTQEMIDRHLCDDDVDMNFGKGHDFFLMVEGNLKKIWPII